MTLRTLLELARISNLPTVWSNVLAGAVLSGAEVRAAPVAVAGVAGSLLYSGGMFLNDAFDAAVDAKERPERPIPSGRVARGTVLALGFGMLALALGVLGAFVAVAGGGSSAAPSPALVVAGLAIAAGVLVYDRFHKGVWWSPVVMGFCRAGLYAAGALCVSSELGSSVLLPALSLLLYVVGLTYVARFENTSALGRVWPAAFAFAPAVVAVAGVAAQAPAERLVAFGGVLVAHVAWTLRSLGVALRGGRGAIPRAVVSLIAGISLVDAVFIALGRGAGYEAVLAAVAAFALTLLFQRWIRGT